MMRTRRRVLAIIAVLLLVLGIRFVALQEPQTLVGYAWFRSSYALAHDPNAMLQNYASILARNNGSYIPEKVDAFLCSRAQQLSPSTDLDAITDFYAFKAGGREGRFIYRLPEETRQKIIGTILSRIDGYNPRQTETGLVLVEVLRQSQLLGKARFAGGPDELHKLARGKELFKRWWSLKANWEQKKKIDPLASSKLQIVSP